MNTLQVVLGIALGLGWLCIAVVNDWLAWRQYVKKEKDVPSRLPMIGFILAYFSIQLLSVGQPLKYGALLLALVLDFGSLIIVIGLLAFPVFWVREKFGKY